MAAKQANERERRERERERREEILHVHALQRRERMDVYYWKELGIVS